MASEEKIEEAVHQLASAVVSLQQLSEDERAIALTSAFGLRAPEVIPVFERFLAADAAGEMLYPWMR